MDLLTALSLFTLYIQCEPLITFSIVQPDLAHYVCGQNNSIFLYLG